MFVLKPCPLCGSENIRHRPEIGIECRDCGLWLGAGSGALDRWRKITGREDVPLGYLADVWNTRPNGEV